MTGKSVIGLVLLTSTFFKFIGKGGGVDVGV